MKKIIFYSLLALTSCTNNMGTANPEGIYAAYHENEFDKTHDTLDVRRANDGKGIYKIYRSASYIRRMDGKTYPKKNIAELYITRYNEENQLFEELRTGKFFVWDSRKQVLMFGNTAFLKIQ